MTGNLMDSMIFKIFGKTIGADICFSFLFNHLKRLKCLDNGFFLFLRRLR